MKTFIVQCDNTELENKLVDTIIQYLANNNCESQVESVGDFTVHFINAKQRDASEQSFDDNGQDNVTTDEPLPEPVIEPAEVSQDLSAEISSETELQPSPTSSVAPFQSMCKLWDLSSNTQVPCVHDPLSKISYLCVKQCEVVGDYVMFTYAGMMHKVPRAVSSDPCCNKDAIITPSSVCVSLSIADGAIFRCLLSVKCDDGEERVVIGNDLEHEIPSTDIEVINGSISTK
jgi:hypothetical protein